ncbi:unnamed protein product [Cladocopium goreaui]|uniref:PrcB C-terminal domain-containing protein n=1 Tax=Cladocopium goreaui TaxID=2562237 RepID=A0A9P1DP87_9DINO|nr:unnamed protein product [Cladocopium goreaui]
MPVGFGTLLAGTHSGIDESIKKVIESKADLADLWTRHFSICSSSDPLPEINFEEEVVVCVFAGEQGSGGYSISVKSIEDTDERKIGVEFTCPGATAITTCALTQPHHVIRMPKTSLPVSFVDIETAAEPSSTGVPTRFLLTFEGTKELKAAEEVKGLDGVLETEAMLDGRLLVVTVKSRFPLRKQLESVDGVQSVEIDG